ncbi:hemerythrin domain-containing protein [Noviherbaspirillum sp. 17J57-3]|uniref:Hemerythrin domain-containing protein n=1 Tax=Noviherbaspirillum galbum TaxID=2709383 RepID=A0A6B3SQY7_9BURK|nr:hemerythrin domain-containing protein [Noviherbaspirillum galbum]
MDAVQYLTAQHRLLEEMMDQVADADEGEKKQVFASVADQLTVHIASEERIFYPAVKAARTEDILLESLEEHLSLKRLLADLLEMKPSEQTFDPKFKVLKEQTEHHHKEEEEHLFPKVLKLMDAVRRQELGEEMRALQEELSRRGEPRETVTKETGSAAPLR